MLIFVSCASHKKSEKYLDIDARLKSIEEFNRKTLSKISEFDWSLTHEFEDLDINIKRYDTQAQPDSLGNYPMKEEENRKSRREKQKEEQKQKEGQKEESEISITEIDDANKIVATEDTDDSTDVGSPFNLNWLWFLIIPALVYYLIKKFLLKK